MITGEKADLRQILTVRDLRVAYGQRGGGVWHALNGVSFGVGAGEIVAVLGESGSGKSTLAASLLRLLPGNGRITSGEILLDGADIVRMDAVQLRRMRGSGVSIVFQEPSLALPPTILIGEQIGEDFRAPGTLGKLESVSLVREILGKGFSGEICRTFLSSPLVMIVGE